MAKPQGGMTDHLDTCCGSPAYAAPGEFLIIFIVFLYFISLFIYFLTFSYSVLVIDFVFWIVLQDCHVLANKAVASVSLDKLYVYPCTSLGLAAHLVSLPSFGWSLHEQPACIC